jgi:hypothetical protein
MADLHSEELPHQPDANSILLRPSKLPIGAGGVGSAHYRGRVRNFFARRVSRNCLLELSVNEKELRPLKRYLASEGYVMTKVSAKSSCILMYAKTDEDGNARGIDVLFETTPAGFFSRVLRCAYTTASLCFVSWNKAFRLFPRQSLIQRRAFLTHRPSDETGVHLANLTSEGYTIMYAACKVTARSKDHIALTRPQHISDNHSWVINLKIDGVHQPNDPNKNSIIDTGTLQLRLHTPRDW